MEIGKVQKPVWKIYLGVFSEDSSFDDGRLYCPLTLHHVIACYNINRGCHYFDATVCPNEAETCISVNVSEACLSAEVSAASRKQEAFVYKMS